MAKVITAMLLTALLGAAYGSRPPSEVYNKVDANLALHDKKGPRKMCESTLSSSPENRFTTATEMQRNLSLLIWIVSLRC